MVKILLLSALLCVLSVPCRARTVVVDAVDATPLPAASVFDATGRMVALTDADGAFSAALPATVRCMGYEPATLAVDADTLRMSPASYELQGMTVNLAERDVLRLVCYVREFMGMAADSTTSVLYAEYMVDYMLPMRKLKKFKGRFSPRVLAKRSVMRMSRTDAADSIAADPEGADELSWLQLASMPAPSPDGTYEMLPDSVRGRACSYSVPGKYGTLREYRVTPALVTVNVDPLADSEEHRISPWFFKLFGFTIDIAELTSSTGYVPPESGELRPEDMVMRTFSMEALARGKLFKKLLGCKSDMKMKAFFEIYPVDREYLTATEARAAEKEKPATPALEVPDNAAPLDEATLNMLEAARKLR